MRIITRFFFYSLYIYIFFKKKKSVSTPHPPDRPGEGGCVPRLIAGYPPLAADDGLRPRAERETSLGADSRRPSRSEPPPARMTPPPGGPIRTFSPARPVRVHVEYVSR